MGKTKYLMAFLLGVGLYFKVARELVLARGGFFVGGEIFLIFLPLIIWVFERAVFDR